MQETSKAGFRLVYLHQSCIVGQEAEQNLLQYTPRYCIIFHSPHVNEWINNKHIQRKAKWIESIVSLALFWDEYIFWGYDRVETMIRFWHPSILCLEAFMLFNNFFLQSYYVLKASNHLTLFCEQRKSHG